MKSNICKIDSGTRDLAAILRESEKVAVYNELNHKQTMQLRLICEEIDGMLPNIIDDFEGAFWIEFEDGVCKVKVSLRFEEFTAVKKADLVGIAKNKKNAAARGIVGKIRSAIENVFLDEDVISDYEIASGSYYYTTEYNEYMDYSCLWTLDRYKSIVGKEDQSEEWDELEKSLIASLADDVIVGVKGKQADIIIVKKFA